MLYLHPQYKKYFYIAAGWFCIFILLRYKEIGKLFAGSASSALMFLLFFQIIFIPLLFILAGFYTRDITITTDDEGIKFNSWFKKVKLKWDEIKIIQRVSWWIKIIADKGSFSVSPLILSSPTTKVSPKGNIFKRCELLKEMYLKANNAEFKNFPEGTFDEANKS